ncbi:MAG: PQQ-like beta-propeller repeat protein [Phycisphaera sp.]|nr:MAG: PQQ-like beta-propeller repeat protein [Phycisphaera sp.]
MSTQTSLQRFTTLAAAAGLALSIAGSQALGQGETSSIYVDDSTATQSTLRSLPSLLRAGNEAEAVRALQASLDTGPNRLVPTEEDADLFVSVRDAIHERLVAEPELLERYRVEHSARARRMLGEGRYAEVERSYLLTPAGYEAALNVARERFGLARFESAARVLAQLEGHPDRRADARAAAELLTRVAAQLDDEPARAMARAWREQAGLEPADFAALEIPKPAAVVRRDASTISGGQRPPHLPGEEPWSQAIDRDLAPGPDDTLPPPPPIEPKGGGFWLMPMVAGDTILINDGGTLSAWDRYSLRLRWRKSILTNEGSIRDIAGARREPQTWRSIEAPNTVAADARAAYASMGLHMSSAPDLAVGIIAVDLQSGDHLWTADTRNLDPRYALANVRGGPVAGEGRVIFGLREDNRAGRQVGTALVGLDALTGEPAWMRSLGSAGTGWSRSNRNVGAGGVIEGGVVYWFEPMGVVAAFDAHDGRPIWLRRFDTSVRPDRRSAVGAWMVRPPVVKGDSVLALVDRLEMIYRLDRKTGRELGRVSSVALSNADYLVGVGDHVAAVSGSNVWFFEPEAVRMNRRQSDAFELADGFEALITGRAMAAGGSLMVPSGDAAVLLDPATGEMDGPIIALPRSGSVVPLEDQIVVVDTGVLESVMGADVAAMALTQRLQDDPDDIASLVSLVLLAQRQDVLDAVPQAAERALEALGRAGENGEVALRRAQSETRRLFEALLSMTVRMVGLDAAERDDELADELARLAFEAAPGSKGRARALLTIAELRDTQGRAAESAVAYLDVLADASLRIAVVGPDAEAAGVLATRRLQKLLPMHGYGIIEPHERAAAEALALADAGPAGDEARLGVASRLPVSMAAVEAYSSVARVAEADGKIERATRAWRRALDAARLVRTSGGPVSGADVAALGANLARVLAESDHVAAAGRVIRQLRAVSPIETIDAPDLAQLAERFAQRQRGARVGNRPVEVSQRLDGWNLVTPMATEVETAVPEHAVLAAGHLVGVWALAPDLGPIEGEPFEADPKGPLELVWTATHDPSRPPTLLRQDRERALFVWQTGGLAGLRSVSFFDASEWSLPSLIGLFGEDLREPNLGDRGPHVAALMATGQQADPLSWVIASDGAHVAVARRDGLLAVLDATTGEKLYAGRQGLGTVMDVAIAGGRVWVMGSTEAPGSPSAGEIESLALWGFGVDGTEAVRRVGMPEPPRWLAAVEDGSVVMGTHSSIASYGVDETGDAGRVVWESNDDAALNAALGWVLGDALLVMSSRGDLSMAHTGDGTFDSKRIMLSLDDGEVPRLSRQGERVVVLTTGGVTVLDASGEVMGRDALRSNGGRTYEKLPPALGENRVLLVPQGSFSINNGQGEYIVSTVDTVSAKVTGTRAILLPEPPRVARLIDGYGLISTGQRTVVLRFE